MSCNSPIVVGATESDSIVSAEVENVVEASSSTENVDEIPMEMQSLPVDLNDPDMDLVCHCTSPSFT